MNKPIISPGGGKEKALLFRCLLLSGTMLLADQVTKALIEKNITCPIEIIPGFFSIVRVGNTGAAWGMLAGQQWLLLAVSVAFLLFMVFFFRKLTEGWPERYYALALVAGGILGNSVDRIWRSGTVVDFLDFYISRHHWPAFNVADSSICIGVGIYMLSSMLRPESEKNANSAKKDNTGVPEENGTG